MPDNEQTFDQNVAQVGGAGLSDAQLLVCIDGVPSDQVALQFADGGQQWMFQVPADYPAGTHQLQVQDPAGTGNASTLIGLVGHPAQPALSCFPTGNWIGNAVEPEPLASTASQGTQLGVAFPATSCNTAPAPPTGGMWVKLARYEPGGALDDPFCTPIDSTTVNRFARPPTVPVGAGRHRVYLSDGETSQLMLVSSLVEAGGQPPPVVIDPTPGQQLVPVAVQEPALDSPYFWVVSANDGGPLTTVSLAMWPMTANLSVDAATPIGTITSIDGGSAAPFIGPTDAPCVNAHLVAATFVGEALNLAISCESQIHPGFHELSQGRLTLPDPTTLSGPIPLVPVWRRIQVNPTLVGPTWTARLGLQTTLIITSPADVLRPGVVINDNFIGDDPFGFPLQPVPGEDLIISDSALAPDGQQVIVVPDGGGRVEIFEPQTDPSTNLPQWREFGSFTVPANSAAGLVSYDPSGAQAVLLLHEVPTDGGSVITGATGGYCVLN